MNWVDWVIVVILLIAGLRGFYAGAAAQTLTVIGIFLGLLIGVLLVPPLAGFFTGTARAFVALAVLVIFTTALGAAGELLGRRTRSWLARFHLGLADAIVGIAVSLVAAILAVWVFGTVLSASRYATLNGALRDSSVLRAVERTLPPLPELFTRVESFLSEQGFPVVFANLPPGLVAPAQPPDDASIQAAFQAAKASTVKIVGRACDLIESGSGFVAAPGLVVTNAHVVAGETSTQVVDALGTHRGTVVLFDPNLDVAVLRVSGLTEPPLAIRDQTVARDTTGAIMGYPGGGPLQADPAAVNAVFRASGLNIYGTAVTVRSIYELNGDVLPGNSGGPLVASGQATGTAGLAPGTVIGLIFANSTTTAHVGYALTMDAVAADITRAEQTTATAGTGPCLP